MATLTPSTSTENVLLTKATAPKFYAKAADLTFRRRLVWAMVGKYGTREMNATSFSCVWNAEIKQPEVQQYDDAGLIQFSEHDPLIQFSTNVRGYIATDRLSLKKELMNRGATQLDNLKQNKPIRLTKALMNTLNAEIYVDGNAAGNTNRFHGIESFLGDDGATVVGDLIANNSDTYAGQTIGLGNGGTWSTTAGITAPNATIGNDYPYGKGSSEYDALAPLLVNFASSSWGTGSATFEDNCESALRFARIIQLNRGAKGEDERTPYMHIFAPDLMFQFLNHWAPKTRLLASHGESERLGFGNALNFEGDVVHSEYDCPPGTGYGISPAMLEFFFLGPNVYTELNEFQMANLGTNFGVYTFGNARYQTKFFTKYKSYAAA